MDTGLKEMFFCSRLETALNNEVQLEFEDLVEQVTELTEWDGVDLGKFWKIHILCTFLISLYRVIQGLYGGFYFTIFN